MQLATATGTQTAYQSSYVLNAGVNAELLITCRNRKSYEYHNDDVQVPRLGLQSMQLQSEQNSI